MAIEKTLFTQSTLDTRRTEVYNWLTANATEYFSEITIDDNKQIVCTIANGGSVVFGYGTNSTDLYNGTITLANGTSYKSSSSTPTVSNKHTYAVKMDNGIYLYAYSGSNSSYNACTLISKTNDGAVVISAMLGYHYILCPEKDVMYKIDSDLKAVRTDNTVFCPIVVGENSYTENMLYMPFKQYVTFIGTMTDAEGQKYWYDGTCALKYEE